MLVDVLFHIQIRDHRYYTCDPFLFFGALFGRWKTKLEFSST